MLRSINNIYCSQLICLSVSWPLELYVCLWVCSGCCLCNGTCVCVCVCWVLKLYRRAWVTALATLWLQQLLRFTSSVCQCGNINDCHPNIFILVCEEDCFKNKSNKNSRYSKKKEVMFYIRCTFIMLYSTAASFANIIAKY